MARILVNRHHASDPVWHVQVAVIVAVILQLLLPDSFVVGHRVIIYLSSIALLFALSYTTPKQSEFNSVGRRLNVFLLTFIIGSTNVYSLIRAVTSLLGTSTISGHDLILTAINIYVTNIIVFALVYWEMDAGGPGKRRAAALDDHDFLFPQANLPAGNWHPTFIDYVYVSSTNATAFSPTDTMPLSRRAKMLMLAQSLVSLITIALIAGRAVNILK